MEFPDFVQLLTDSLTLMMGGLFLLATGFLVLDRHQVDKQAATSKPFDDEYSDHDEERRAA